MAKKTSAVIDTDFFNKLTEEDGTGDKFFSVLDSLGYSPVMHEYVFEIELEKNTLAKQFVNDGLIKIIKTDEYINDQNRFLYEDSFRYLYNDLNGHNLAENINVFKYKGYKQSLGEIGSILMAKYLNIPYILSDDSDSKQVAESVVVSSRGEFTVKNIFEVYSELLENELTNWSVEQKFLHRVLSPKKYTDLAVKYAA